MELPFESMSAKQAMTVLHGQADATTANREKDWSAVRQAKPVEQVRITKEVNAWLSQLPADIRPRALAIQYPRIFNKIAALWIDPLSCEKYLDELMLDNRGSRQGFPADIAEELVSLKKHLVDTTNIQKIGVWGERIGSSS
jgi:hypothetical protein